MHAGIQYNGWTDTDSAWMGPSLRIILLSKLTVQLARFTRAHMFGPGTMCHCATCSKMPINCTWGKGPYEGTLLLYAQEIALNVMWTQREYEAAQAMPYFLDGSTIYNDSICKQALLHARHNSEDFSKVSCIVDVMLNKLTSLSLHSWMESTKRMTCQIWTSQ